MHKNCIMPMTEHIPTGIYAFTKTQWLDHADVDLRHRQICFIYQ